MKKTGTILFAGVFLVMVFCARCKNDTSMTESDQQHLLKLDTIRDQYNSKREQKDWTVITQGSIHIEVSEGMVTIDHIPEQGPELITYFLQTDTKDMNLKSDSLGKSEVLFLGRNLIIHTLLEKKPLLFTVRDDKVPVYLTDFTDVHQYFGYGLGARQFERDGLHEDVPFCLCKKLGAPSDDCNIGGDGGAHGCATGTPNGSCQISCSIDAFACCDQQRR